MNHLKSALGKQQKQQKSISRMAYGVKNYNKSKSESIWALDPDVTESAQNQKHIKNDNKIDDILVSSLRSAYNKQKQCSQIVFYDIIQNIQIILNQKQKQILQLDCLLIIQKKSRQIIDLSKQQQKNFNASFYELLVKRIKKLKKKQKKDDLKQYHQIISSNFKKKNLQFINQNQNRKDCLQNKDNLLNYKNNNNKIIKSDKLTNSNDGSQSKKSNSSNQGKLKNLLSSQKFKQKQKDQLDKKQKNKQLTAQTNLSFSSVVNSTMGVRQRQSRAGIKKDKPIEQTINNHISNHDKQEDQQESKDEAFIFFRPKRSKKNQ